jgi:hypothetical protein
MKRTWAMSGLLVVMLVVAQTASSALISVDLGTNNATVTTERTPGQLWTGDLYDLGNQSNDDQIGIWENTGAANVWNYTTYSGASGLYDADGNVTGVGFAVTQAAASAGNWGVDDLLSDGVYAEPNGGQVLWNVSGLTPNGAYKLVVYSSALYPATLVTVNGISPTAYAGAKSPKSYTEGTQFWYFEVQADIDGKLNGVSTNAPGDGTHNTLVGVQLDVIPEPASLGMLGAAAAAMLLRRRFRR